MHALDHKNILKFFAWWVHKSLLMLVGKASVPLAAAPSMEQQGIKWQQ
jgi:hypothetical protein